MPRGVYRRNGTAPTEAEIDREVNRALAAMKELDKSLTTMRTMRSRLNESINTAETAMAQLLNQPQAAGIGRF